MMTKKKTPMIKRAKFAFILPIVALLLFAFAEPEYRYAEAEMPSKVVSTLESLEKETVKMTGLVLDENDEPMPGVSVIIGGTTTGTVSDRSGKFKLEVPKDASIILSFVGKETIADSYDRITSGNNEDGIFNQKYQMKDAVIILDTEIPPPPPPPAPKTKKESSTPPPPPPPPAKTEKTKLKKGEKEEMVFFVVEDMPKYPGGHWDLVLYVNNMQKKIAKEKKVKGKAKVAFTVDALGKVNNIKVVEKDNDGAAKGAYMIAKEMEDWKPGKQRGKAVPVKYLLPVEFK